MPTTPAVSTVPAPSPAVSTMPSIEIEIDPSRPVLDLVVAGVELEGTERELSCPVATKVCGRLPIVLVE